MISTKHHRLKTKLQFILQHINKDETAGRKKRSSDWCLQSHHLRPEWRSCHDVVKAKSENRHLSEP